MSIDKKMIYSKLNQSHLGYNYIINNVTVGLEMALDSNEVKKVPELEKKIIEYLNQVKELDMSTFGKVNVEDQEKAILIGQKVIELIDQYL
ncbi:conserved hypothetical protein [Tenacibaculum sp. 190524A02b]|uniref:Uncharacterized protein n=1 Tax=Tenacibaculum vairaonense TaxID=3137860 RepID=A0ABP1FA51_9FLAO